MAVEEQAQLFTKLRREGELGKTYVHQLTVQGRLPDRFKFAAIALILSSPYPNNWEEPFFTSPWGRVAPLVHDGGYVKLDTNPLWREIEGRTDFLQRVGLVHQPKLEAMEKLTPQERAKYSIDELAKARAEQEERGRLILEAKAYQRLALALHSRLGSVPKELPAEMRQELADHWSYFEQSMRGLLGEYGIQGVVNVRWFTSKPRVLKLWSGERFEAPYNPIKRRLIHLEEVRQQNPELRSMVTNLIQEITDSIDRTIGLLPKTPLVE